MKKNMEENNKSLIFEGMVSVRAVIESGKRSIERVYYDEKRAQSHKSELAWLGHRADEQGFEIELCEKEKIDTIASGGTHGGVCALCCEREIRPLTANDVIEGGFYLILEGIEDPFNFGFAVRSAYAAGADGIILPPRNWMDSAGTVCRSSAGASERIPMFIIPEGDVSAVFKPKGYKLAAAEIADSEPMWDADLSRPLALVIGGEKRGISRSLLDKCDARVRIEYGRGFNQSLSAASASAVLCFEVMRQNRAK